MKVKKSLKIPVHYGTTNTKVGILYRLTSRITYCIMLISELIDKDTKLDRATIRKLVRSSDIEERTGLSYGFRDQCIDKVIWTWRSYKKLHRDWEKKLEKGKTIDIPLNPAQYHLNQLKNAEIDDFEIVKRNKKYYVHISITKFVEDKPISSIGGGDQGLNRTIAVVLLTNPPREEHLLDAAKRGMPKLRKRIGKWSYSRQRKMIALKRAELGYPTMFDEERDTSKKCHICKSMLTTRKWDNGYSWIQCHSCGAKIDADFNAAYNISEKVPLTAVWIYNSSLERYNALRCQDDWLKVHMTMEGGKLHASA